MKSLVGQQVGFKLKRKRCVKSAISNHGFKLVSMKIISHLVLYCYGLLTVFIVCLGSIKDIVFIVVSCHCLVCRCLVRLFLYSDCVSEHEESKITVEFDQTLAQLIHFVAGGTFLAGFFKAVLQTMLFKTAGLKCRSQARLQVTGHRPGYRSQARSQVRPQATG